jgi:hypothetical protein
MSSRAERPDAGRPAWRLPRSCVSSSAAPPSSGKPGSLAGRRFLPAGWPGWPARPSMRADSKSSGGIGERSLTSWGGTPAWAKKLIRRSVGQPVAGSGDPEGGRALVLTRGARVLPTQSKRTPPSTNAGCSMATRILFLSGQETAVTETEDEVVQAVRRAHPNRSSWRASTAWSSTSTGRTSPRPPALAPIP